MQLLNLGVSREHSNVMSWAMSPCVPQENFIIPLVSSIASHGDQTPAPLTRSLSLYNRDILQTVEKNGGAKVMG